MRKPCLLLILTLLCTLYGKADKLPEELRSGFQVIKDLNREWVTVGEDNRYIPYIDKSMASVPIVGISLDLSRYSSNQLIVCMPANSALLVEKKISSFHQEVTCARLNIDSLRQIHGKASLFISVYQPQRNFEQIGMWVVQELSGTQVLSANAISKRSQGLLDDFFAIGIVFILILYAVVINQYPKIFSNLFSLSRVFSLRAREDNSRIRLVNEAHIVFLVQHCFLLAFLFIIFVSTTDTIDVELPYIDFYPVTFGGYAFLWAKLALVMFGVIWAKYVLIMIFGSLFRLRQLRHLHMLDYMRMSLVYGAILFALLILVFAGLGYYQSTYFDVLIYLFVALSGLRVIVLYFRLFSSASFRNMYLVSYLCVAEVIPLLIGLEVLVI